MRLIVCVDDGMGMMFNKRRQSKDAKVREDMLAMLSCDKTLFVTPYTAKQFLPEEQERLTVLDDGLQGGLPGAEEYFFAEDTPVIGLETATEQVILYRWNRAYPSDVKFLFDLSGYELISCEDFIGNSHPEMKKEIYRKRVIS
ncbi:MAG: ribonuclease Z [Lachnospiraceae bacterium]|nr:ribonuclease Z [Lachnospiraceae bacterium]